MNSVGFANNSTLLSLFFASTRGHIFSRQLATGRVPETKARCIKSYQPLDYTSGVCRYPARCGLGWECQPRSFRYLKKAESIEEGKRYGRWRGGRKSCTYYTSMHTILPLGSVPSCLGCRWGFLPFLAGGGVIYQPSDGVRVTYLLVDKFCVFRRNVLYPGRLTAACRTNID